MLNKSSNLYHNRPWLWAIFLQILAMAVMAILLGSGCKKENKGASKPEKIPNTTKTTQKNTKEDARLFLIELYKEVLEDEVDFDKKGKSFLNALVQGASREGIYHAFVYSKAFKEKAHTGFTPDPRVIMFLKNEGPKIFSSKITVNVQNRFALKRDFAKALLLQWEQFRKSAGADGKIAHVKRAQWFGKITSQWASFGHDLGAPMRNVNDPKRQSAWAASHDSDLVISELMLRAHILFNRIAAQK